MKYFIRKTLLISIILIAGKSIVCSQPSLESNYQLSQELYNKGEYKQAIEVINRVLKVDSTDVNYYLLRANAYYELEEYDNTIKDCYQMLRLQPHLPEVYMLRGKVCVVTRSYGGAILFFGKAIQFTSENDLLFQAFYYRGEAYYELKRYSDAKTSLESAYDINSEDQDLLTLLASTHLKLNESGKALELVNKVLEANSENATAQVLLGKIAMQQEDYVTAVSAFEKHVELNPVPDAYNQLAEVYFETQNYDGAMESLNKSLALDPSDPLPYKIKGILYVEQGSLEVGCDHLFQALQLGYLEKYGWDLLDIYLKVCEEIE